MIVGILNTDTIKPEFATKYGQYPEMFRKALLAANPNLQFINYEVQSNEYPKDPDECQAYLITGSKASAYDDLKWVKNLKIYINSLHEDRKKIIGICFGHQLIAEALGGSVKKSKQGWHVGVDSVQLNQDASNFGEDRDEFALIYNHQDEVTSLPPNATLLASSQTCPFAMMSIDEHILTFQGHIEFEKGYAKDLFDMRKEILGASLYHQACESLEASTDDLKISKWILDFLS